MGIKGTGNMIRITASKDVKAALARKLIPLENSSPRYSATPTTQMNLPLSSTLSIPMTVARMRAAYKDSLGDFELGILRPVMLNVLNSIKYCMHSGQRFALIAHSSKIISPLLWDVVTQWLHHSGFLVQEDIREVVLIEDAQNQGGTRVKVLFGAKVFWSRTLADQEALIQIADSSLQELVTLPPPLPPTHTTQTTPNEELRDNEA